ncbi:MAG: glycine cleavage system aminomethyltransferase GcvT [Hydrogenobacter thermophilus]|uniref:glycine cleavage system aminomethyltransferase GcvT n=1 Tax=Hydrogenobacter thermophilus TaxID=940 RepID=UPI001C759273|nr:glycine cleavage system aminomethyltransferase GcvT [Hydrogenobacter thermophilus]QWK20017.1 MAG: glycine cleavage system aminomethyltransferase GcvT [Hydrogenobacter thermophilus]
MRTPLYELHQQLKAKMFEFASWQMPLYYSSIKEEVKAVRDECGVFDVSHMGRILMKGPSALETLDYLTTNNMKKLNPGKVQYSMITNHQGGVVDDITLYMLDQESFMLCINAANRKKVINWLSKYHPVEDISDSTLQLALQGKKSADVLSSLFPVNEIKRYNFKVFDGIIVSRTGYTGEDGFEIYASVKEGLEIFKELIKYAKPCGLGARDVLRIEAGLPLYGHELSEDITPFEANLDRFVYTDKDFLGKSAMLKREIHRKLFGLELLQRGVPREDYRIYLSDTEIGRVSSGTYSPTLDKGIALCFVDISFRKEGLEVELDVRGKRLKALLRNYPFVHR